MAWFGAAGPERCSAWLLSLHLEPSHFGQTDFRVQTDARPSALATSHAEIAFLAKAEVVCGRCVLD